MDDSTWGVEFWLGLEEGSREEGMSCMEGAFLFLLTGSLFRKLNYTYAKRYAYVVAE